MKRKYYSQRENGGKNEKKISLYDLKKVFEIVYSEFYDKKYFCEKLELNCCVDQNDPDLNGILLKEMRRDDLWPISDGYEVVGKLKFYTKNDLFDMIEFIFENISKPIETPNLHYHTWCSCGLHYTEFSKKDGQNEFRSEINEFLGDFEGGYELSENGEILHKADHGLKKLLDAQKIDLGKGDINTRMIEAENLFYSGRSNFSDRKNAVKELADCFEFLRDDLKTILNTKDESDLFNIANNFGIRHHNEKQKVEYDKNIWLSWMFHFYLATLHASLRLIEKSKLK